MRQFVREMRESLVRELNWDLCRHCNSIYFFQEYRIFNTTKSTWKVWHSWRLYCSSTRETGRDWCKNWPNHCWYKAYESTKQVRHFDQYPLRNLKHIWNMINKFWIICFVLFCRTCLVYDQAMRAHKSVSRPWVIFSRIIIVSVTIKRCIFITKSYINRKEIWSI